LWLLLVLVAAAMVVVGAGGWGCVAVVVVAVWMQSWRRLGDVVQVDILRQDCSRRSAQPYQDGR
jgi:hypothetical protein